MGISVIEYAKSTVVILVNIKIHLQFLFLLASSVFSNFCISIIADFFSLSVLALCTLYFSLFLIFILCFLSFIGNMCLRFSFFVHFLAKFRHKNSLLSSNVCKFSLC